MERLVNAQHGSKADVIAPDLKEGSNFAEAGKEALQVKSEVEIQAPVVQTMDRTIHRINHYLADKH